MNMKVDKIIEARQLIGGRNYRIVDNPVIGIKDGVVNFVEQAPSRHGAEQVLSLKDLYLLPGLVDAHVHFIFGGENRSYLHVMQNDSNEIMLLRASQNALKHLEAGVTTVRDLGDRDGTMVFLREAISRGIVRGPRLVVSGPPLTPKGGHFYFCHGEVDSEEDIREMIERLQQKGVDLIKIMASGGTSGAVDRRKPSFETKQLANIVREAHKRNMMTSAHVHCTKAIENCLDAGVDSLEHLGFFDSSGNADIDLGLIERMAEAGTFACVTLKNSYLGIRRLKNSHDEASKQRLQEMEREFANRIETVKLCLENNVNLIVGTDSIWEFGDFHVVLRILAEAGIPALEVFKIATAKTAAALKLQDRIGSIEAGKEADIIGYRENPIDHIKEIENPCFVMKQGDTVLQVT